MSELFAHPNHVSFSEITHEDVIGSLNGACSSSPSFVHSSPSRQTQVPPSASVERAVPLGPAKTVGERAVIFSPRNDTKYFHSADSIIAETDAPPPSIRSYPDSDPIASSSGSSSSAVPLHRSSSVPLPPSRAGTPTLFRSILKAKHLEIRVAASVEEGTLHNKEAARLLVSGKRPKLVARDSFQLAMMRKAAGDGMRLQEGGGEEEAPGSDDSAASDEAAAAGILAPTVQESSSDEEEERLQEDGPLGMASLLSIVLDGAEDLLTLEEAYHTLVLRLRAKFESKASSSTSPPEDFSSVVQPFRDEAPSLVRAIQRELQRLLGKVPNSEVPSSEADSSPFRGLMPLRDSTPINNATLAHLTPSPSPTAALSGQKKSPEATRQGYTESEVRYRREAAGVGSAALRFLAFVLHTPELFRCFSEADLQALLEQVMMIPRTPKLPTPNPKRTYFLSIYIVSQMRIPAACVGPARDKIVRAVESAITDNLGSQVLVGKEGPSQIKKEGLAAVANLLSNYPSIFFLHYSDLLVPCLKGLIHSADLIRTRASCAVAAFASAKLRLLAETQAAAIADPDHANREAWIRMKMTAQKCEMFTVSHFRTPLRLPGKTAPIIGQNGEKKTEASALEQVFKETIGTTEGVAWACAAWAVVVSLMGSAYGSSGLASGFDHIINRSLQASNNAVRPLLARAAWNHAVHSYLSAGYSTSLSNPEGNLVLSFKPFAGSSHHDANERMAALQFPLDLALEMANAPDSAKRVLQLVSPSTQEGRYAWERTEKARRHMWIITCGLSAAGLVYAYTGMALGHEDQPAKEMAAILGLPSSDGVAVSESSLDDARLDRLDKTWEKVVRPMLDSLFVVKGVDRLKLHGWNILLAITSTKESQAFSLDRLLSQRYLSGEAFGVDKEAGLAELMNELESEAVKPTDIPSWGTRWMLKRLDFLLDSFRAALTGVYGLDDIETTKWIRSTGGEIVIPMPLSRIWCNILRAIATLKAQVPAQADAEDTFAGGLGLITHHLVTVFRLNPATYMPIQLIGADDRYVQDTEATRIGLVSHLIDAVVQILGKEAIGAVRLELGGGLDIRRAQEEGGVGEHVFGADAEGRPTIAGALLGALLRRKPREEPLSSPAKTAFKALIGKVFAAGLAPGCTGKLLGDMTNCLPWLFEEDEEMQLAVWRLLAMTWPESIDLQPTAAPAAGTNHTGALLVSLLSSPFRGRQVTSYWHQHAGEDDFAIWKTLLKVTVLRFRAKRVGSNLGVLETLAGHLGDFLEGEKTCSTTITLSCLAAAASWITFVPTEHHHSSHFINENHVPVDFLGLVSRALEESYPSPETASTSTPLGQIVSPALASLLDNVAEVVRDLPAEYVRDCSNPIKQGLAIWMADELKVADEELGRKLDDLYIVLVHSLQSAIQAGHVAATCETLDIYIEIFAPRLSRALTSKVPKAFQAFWKTCFQDVELLELSDEVAEFLGDVVAAVPGMIEVKGWAKAEGGMSEEESLARFPNALVLATQPAPYPPTADVVHDSTELPAEAVFEDAPSFSASEAVEVVEVVEVIEAVEAAEVIQAIDDVLPDVVVHAVEATDVRVGEYSAVPEALEASRSVEKYDADVSQSFEGRPARQVPSEDVTSSSQVTIAPPQSANIIEIDAERVDQSGTEARALLLIRDDIIGIEVHSGPSPNLSEPDSERAASEILSSEDVFGPRGAVQRGKKRSKRQAIPEAKRSKSDSTIAPPRRKGTPDSPEIGELIVAVPSDSLPSSQSGEGEKLGVRNARAPTQPRASILSSAGRWLAKVPSFGALPFFSPARPDEAAAAAAEQEAKEASSSGMSERFVRKERRGRKRAVAEADEAQAQAQAEVAPKEEGGGRPGLRSRSASEASDAGSVALGPVADLESKQYKRRRTGRAGKSGKGPSSSISRSSSLASVIEDDPVAVEGDEEDELLLSPESARRRKREEEGAIRAAEVARGAEDNASPRPTKVRRGSMQEDSQQSLGRYDDAPEDVFLALAPNSKSDSPRPAAADEPATTSRSGQEEQSGPSRSSPGATPASARSSQQARVIHMLEEAARASRVVESLDFEGVMRLLRSINELRDAATANLEGRARRGRGGR